MFDTAFWKIVATTPEPELCAICDDGNGNRYHAPAHFCHDCRALLAETATEGYVLLDLYDLEDIRAFVIEDGAEYTIRDYTVSIYKDKENGGLFVEVTGHLFDEE